MEYLGKLLWSKTPDSRSHALIPKYREGVDEDSVDLQIKSLMYMFRREDIAHAEPLYIAASLSKSRGRLASQKSCIDLRASTHKHESGSSPSADTLSTIGISDFERDKLDLMYNRTEFKRVLMKDEHRILIDWTKNKFRSLCILSGTPTELDSLPSFNADDFRFMVLPPDADVNEYVRVLTLSDIYVEHWKHVPLDSRQTIARRALQVVRESKGPDAVFDKNDRAFVIRYYLNKTAVEVQSDRLFKGWQKSPDSNKENNATRTNHDRDRSVSPVRRSDGENSEWRTPRSPVLRGGERLSDKPARELRLAPSMDFELVSSPTKAKMKSPPRLRTKASAMVLGSSTVSPPASPHKKSLPLLHSQSSLAQLPSLNLKVDETLSISPPRQDKKPDLRKQAREAVKMRLLKERKIISGI